MARWISTRAARDPRTWTCALATSSYRRAHVQRSSLSRWMAAAADHVAQLNAKAPGLAVDSEMAGAFAHGAWLGKLRKLQRQRQRSRCIWSSMRRWTCCCPADRSRVDWFCLNGEPARVCADADWAPAKWTATVNANDLPISTLTSGLTPSVDYRGRLTVTARAFGGGRRAGAGQSARGSRRCGHRAQARERAHRAHHARHRARHRERHAVDGRLRQ